MLLERKCVVEAVYDESDFYYTHSCKQNLHWKFFSHIFQVHILNTSRVCVWERERKGLREMFTYRKNHGVVKRTNFVFSPKLVFFFFLIFVFCYCLYYFLIIIFAWWCSSLDIIRISRLWILRSLSCRSLFNI